ncbi:MAG: HD domain-containing protein [Candidatus Bipolaricaulaceae bacterium]
MEVNEQIRTVLPEVDWIDDPGLREAVIRAYQLALAQGGWRPADMTRMPFTLLKQTDISYADHVRAVTRLARAAADTFADLFGGEITVNHDALVAGALVHDVGKLVEVEEREGRFAKSPGGKVLRHPFSGVALAAAAGLPPEVQHIIAVHSKEGDPYPRTVEGVIVHHADFTCFDSLK